MFVVRNLVDSFLAHLRVQVSVGQIEHTTRDWYSAQLVKLTRAVGDFPAAELRAHHLIAVKLTYHFVRALRALYRWAVDDDVQLVPRDPFRKLKAPPCGERQRVLSRPEMVRLYLASSRRLRRLLFVLAHTIARPGEIRGLTWGVIRWDQRLIVLTNFKGKKRRRDGVKVRTIPLDRPTLRLLRNIYARRGCPGPDVPVWLDRDGKQWTANAVRCQMRKARQRAGLDPDGVERVVCYTLRHTGATEATRRNILGEKLSQTMGHTKSATTDRYRHLSGEDLLEVVDTLAARPRAPRAG